MFQFLDTQLNCGMLYVLLHGILAVTLWNISEVNSTVIDKCLPLRQALVVVIILLYVLITIGFAVGWSSMHSAFIGNGQSLRIIYLKLNDMQAFYLERGITASISTSLTDLYMIWCCWVVWGPWRWLIILLPIFSLVSAMVSKIMAVYHEYVNESAGVFPVLYASFILATTLWCTLLIIHRILTVTRIRRGAECDWELFTAGIVKEPSLTLSSVSVAASYDHPNTDVAPETSPHLRNRSLLHDRSSLDEDTILGYTTVDEATVDEDVASKRMEIPNGALVDNMATAGSEQITPYRTRTKGIGETRRLEEEHPLCPSLLLLPSFAPDVSKEANSKSTSLTGRDII
ncbi:hypothetical protein ARMGADRAFT_1035872 [Armillaria gallica]|uniref:Uncharacterized protein n=1 Tax=Armillaria gallica TaxID=47427 RepID=A0A2H3CXF9_ARMGA|nr:hypothetical protein ARMGADRAFT_1035872 [Armillaria gallica]